MPRDWKKKEEYDYMDMHTRELWAWEFLRRNQDYCDDWKKTLSLEMERINNESEGKKRLCIQLFDSSCYKENYQPETLPYKGAKFKWRLYIDEIINPDIDKPSFDQPYPLFHNYGYFYAKDDLVFLSDLKNSEVMAVFDLAKPIQQQLEHFKTLLEEEQKELGYDMKGVIKNVKNKSIYWKDHLRIFDAVKAGANRKEIISVFFKGDKNHDSAVKKLKNSCKRTEIMASGGYLDILQPPSRMKQRYRGCAIPAKGPKSKNGGGKGSF